MDDDHCYRAILGRDGRFDGTFVTAVLTTGIYCRPSCPSITPLRANVRFFPTPAAAQEHGFRACRRCRPEASPGSPEWNLRADAVARAIRLIGDGVVEREGVSGLARRVGYSPRQLQRLLLAEIGVGAMALSLARRAQTAQTLLESTDLRVADVALAAGYGSLRQFNDHVRRVFAVPPTKIRERARSHQATIGTTAMAGGGSGREPGQRITVQLSYRPPLDLDATLDFLGRRAVDGIEGWSGSEYVARVRLPHGPATVRIPTTADDEHAGRTTGARPPTLLCHLELSDVRDFATAVARVRRLLDLDADPIAVAAVLGEDPWLRPAVAARPGLRVPGSLDPFETAVRAVVGQHMALPAARSAMAKVVASIPGTGAPRGGPTDATEKGGPADPARSSDPENGDALRLSPLPDLGIGSAGRGIHHVETVTDGLFPNAGELAGATSLPLPPGPTATVVTLARQVAEGHLVLDPGADRDRVEGQLLAIAGIDRRTAAYIRMRALGDPDVYLAARSPHHTTPGSGAVNPDQRRPWPNPDQWRPWPNPDQWRPWRSYAAAHVWLLPAGGSTGTTTAPTGRRRTRA